MEIKVGEYIRTKDGEIGKYIGNDLKYEMFDYDVNGNKSSCLYNDLVKHSKNIIDLIEVGDYINGKKVINILDGKSIIALIGIIDEQDIKSIVTKEQFAQIEYKLED